ncbi:MAG: phosphate ABC transporter permease subunit PstC [Rhodobacteraceae bacterium]|nr:phosphate ABC transporter permease subunit PstC [Paracoccaceae bacterium]
MITLAFLILLAASVAAYVWNYRAAQSIRKQGTRLSSVSMYHGLYALLVVLIPVVLLMLLWLSLQEPLLERVLMRSLPQASALDDAGARQLILAEIRSIAGGRIFGQPEEWMLVAAERLNQMNQYADRAMIAVQLILVTALFWMCSRRVSASFKAREKTESIVNKILGACCIVAILTTAGIFISLVLETVRFLSFVPITEFLFGLNWEPQIPMREDQVAAEGAFGWIPVLLGTLTITAVAMFIAAPVGLMSAIYLNEFAPEFIRGICKPILEILAGVPTVVYGFFAILVVVPAIRNVGALIGLSVSPNTALAAGGVMGIMLIPFISSFADDALSAVPKDLRDGSLALGATRAETILKVVFPAAIPGIVGGILLAVSRAIGETMIVVMAAGLIAKLTINPLDSVTTVTVQIVTLLIGDTAFDNPKTLAAFALGMMLFIVTLSINVLALRIVHKYREVYD